MRERDLIQKVFIRCCRDSGFGLNVFQAAKLTADTVGCSTVEVWVAFGSIDTMGEIAAGTHPASRAA